MAVIVPHSGVTLPHVPTIRLETLIRAPARRCFDPVTWEARHLGKLQRLTSQITAFDRPHRLVNVGGA